MLPKNSRQACSSQIQYLSNSSKITTNTETAMLSKKNSTTLDVDLPFTDWLNKRGALLWQGSNIFKLEICLNLFAFTWHFNWNTIIYFYNTYFFQNWFGLHFLYIHYTHTHTLYITSFNVKTVHNATPESHNFVFILMLMRKYTYVVLVCTFD